MKLEDVAWVSGHLSRIECVWLLKYTKLEFTVVADGLLAYEWEYISSPPPLLH